VSAPSAEEYNIKDIFELGYVDPAYWRKKPCILDARSRELNQACPLIAIPTPIALKAKDNPHQYLPFILKCPNTANGTLEYISKTKNDKQAILQAVYINKKIVRIQNYLKRPTSSTYTIGTRIDLIENTPTSIDIHGKAVKHEKEELDKFTIELFMGLRNSIDLLHRNVCNVLR